MLVYPHRLIAEPLGGEHLLDIAVVDGLLAPVLVALHQEEQSEVERRHGEDCTIGAGFNSTPWEVSHDKTVRGRWRSWRRRPDRRGRGAHARATATAPAER